MLAADWAAAIGLYHVVISTATVWLVWKAAVRGFGPRVGVLTLLVAAVHVPWIVLTTVNLSETTFTFQMALLVWAGLEVVERPTVRWSAIWGLIFVDAFWVKGTHAFLGPMFLLAILAMRRWSWASMTRVAVPICTVVGAGLILHGVLTYRTIGVFRHELACRRPQLHRGQVSETSATTDPTGSTWLSPVYAQLGMTSAKVWDRPFTDSGYFMREGLKCIQRDPAVLLVSVENVPFLFTGNFLWPATRVFRPALCPAVRALLRALADGRPGDVGGGAAAVAPRDARRGDCVGAAGDRARPVRLCLQERDPLPCAVRRMADPAGDVGLGGGIFACAKRRPRAAPNSSEGAAASVLVFTAAFRLNPIRPAAALAASPAFPFHVVVRSPSCKTLGRFALDQVVITGLTRRTS